MALVFRYCISCGGKTQVDSAVRPEDQRCMLCGARCNVSGDIDTAEDDQFADAAVSSARPPSDEVSHIPTEMVAIHCPKCRSLIAVDSARPLKKQRCYFCGLPIKGKATIKMKPLQGFTEDGTLIRGERRKHRSGWMPVAGVVVSVVLLSTFAIWLKVRKAATAAPAVESPAPMPYQQIQMLMRKFTAATTAEELLPLIRNRAACEQAVRDWCAVHPGVLPLGGHLLHTQQPRKSLGMKISETRVTFKSIPGQMVLAVETPDGYRIDWPSFTGLGDMSMAEFLAKQPASPVLLLVMARRSDYFNNNYRDSNTWHCLRLSDRNGDNAFYAYVPKKSTPPAVLALPEADSNRSLNVRDVTGAMSLRLRFANPESAAALQAEVESVAGEGWFVP